MKKMKKAIRHDNRPFVPLRRANECQLNDIPAQVLYEEKQLGLKRIHKATPEQEQRLMGIVRRLWDIAAMSSGSFSFPLLGVFLYDRNECAADYAEKDVLAVMAFAETGSPRGFIGLNVHALRGDDDYIAFLLCTGVACCAMGGELESPVTGKCLQYYVVQYDQTYNANTAQYFDEKKMLP